MATAATVIVNGGVPFAEPRDGLAYAVYRSFASGLKEFAELLRREPRIAHHKYSPKASAMFASASASSRL